VTDAVRVRLDRAVPDARSREPREERVELYDNEGDAACSCPSRVRLDEERCVLRDVPENLVSDAKIRGPAEEACVPVDARVEIRHRDAGDKLRDRAHPAAPTWSKWPFPTEPTGENDASGSA